MSPNVRGARHTVLVSGPADFPYFRKVGDQVELRGRVNAPEKAGDGYVLIFELSEGYRPDATISCGVYSDGGPLELWIQPDGSVVADQPLRGWIELDGISFQSAQSS